jgi:hypothetical protein
VSWINFFQRAEELSQIMKIIVCAGIEGTDAMRVFDHLTILALIVLITWSVANLVATAKAMVSRHRRGAQISRK